MGYELHITRNAEPNEHDNDGGISLAEWKSYVDGDPSLRLDERAEVFGPGGESMWVAGPGITVWTEHPTANEPGNLAWLHHHGGEITVKNPDQELLAKMLGIASDLQAVVVGDEGEEYTTPESHGVVSSVRQTKPKPWWRFW